MVLTDLEVSFQLFSPLGICQSWWTIGPQGNLSPACIIVHSIFSQIFCYQSYVNFVKKCCDPLMAMYIKNTDPNLSKKVPAPYQSFLWKCYDHLTFCYGPHFPIIIGQWPVFLHINWLRYCQQQSWNLLKNEGIFFKHTLW